MNNSNGERSVGKAIICYRCETHGVYGKSFHEYELEFLRCGGGVYKEDEIGWIE